jgi:hypothetical protein
MLINELLVIPTQETLRMMSAIFSACPFDLFLDRAYVVLNMSEEHMEPEPDLLYSAQAGTLNLWYDTATQMTSLILPLVSPSLNERVVAVREKAPSAFYGEHYFPHMVLAEDFPPVARRYAGFLASVGNSLAALTEPLFFDAELVIQKDYRAVPQADFYASMLANVQNR